MAIVGRSARLWALRRWAYALFILFSVFRLPARTGFQLHRPACDTRLTFASASLSMTKVPHIVLFGAFYLLTALQFDHIDRRMIGWSLAATAAMGLLVELQEGATRTGNCRLTDVLPDIFGGLGVAVMLLAVRALRR